MLECRRSQCLDCREHSGGRGGSLTSEHEEEDENEGEDDDDVPWDMEGDDYPVRDEEEESDEESMEVDDDDDD
jgi:hypothetical protein